MDPDQVPLMDRHVRMTKAGSCRLQQKPRAEPTMSSGDYVELRSTCYLQDGNTSASGKRVTRKLLTACALTCGFMIVEVIGGYLANSVSVMSDAAHMFSDMSAFAISALCTYMVNQRTHPDYSFGYHRAETVGALISVLMIAVLTGGLVLEAAQRLINPQPVDGKIMFIVATVGIVFNIVLAATLGIEHHHHAGGACTHDHGHGHSHGHGAEADHGHGGGCGHGHSHGAAHSHEGGAQDHGHTHEAAPASGGCGHDHSHSEVTASASHVHAVGAHAHSHAGVPCSGDHLHNHDTRDLPTPFASGSASPVAHSHDHSACTGHAHGPPSPGAHSHAVAMPTARHHAHGAPVAAHQHSRACSGHGSHSDGTEHALQHQDAEAASPTCGHSHSRGEHAHEHVDDHSHDHSNLNMRGAVVHVLGDLLQSVGVAIAGAIIWYTQGDSRFLVVDPLCTFLFAGLVVWVSKDLVKDIVIVLMEATPKGVSVDKMIDRLNQVEGVMEVHDLHVWSLGTGKNMLTAHIDAADNCENYKVLASVEKIVHEMGVQHSTVQICSGAA